MDSQTHPLRGRRILLGVGGGIAAYKSVYLLRLLVKAGAQVQVAMSAGAREFITPLSFQALSGKPVFCELFDLQQDADIGHIRVADECDLMIVAPATANLLARMCSGMANGPVTAAALATRSTILVAPSMNVNMWDHPATQKSLEILQNRGIVRVGPDDGFLACKWSGTGRMAEPEHIAEAAARLVAPKDLEGRHVVISAGGTCEDIDPVRYIGNRSTGKMGFALAQAAWRRGASVTLVSAPTHLDTPLGVDRIDVRSAEEMHEAMIRRARRADVCIMSAAVADYRPAQRSDEKLKKEAWGDEPSIALERTRDILAELGSADKRPYLVGFAAETENMARAAAAKRRAKGCDLLVGNDVSQAGRGFGTDTNEVLLLWEEGEARLPLASKEDIAWGICDAIVRGLRGELRE